MTATEKPESVEADCKMPETCGVCHVCQSYHHDTKGHTPCECAAEARAERLEKALREILAAMPEFKDVPIGPEDDWCVRTDSIRSLTIGAIRRARAILPDTTRDSE